MLWRTHIRQSEKFAGIYEQRKHIAVSKLLSFLIDSLNQLEGAGA